MGEPTDAVGHSGSHCGEGLSIPRQGLSAVPMRTIAAAVQCSYCRDTVGILSGHTVCQPYQQMCLCAPVFQQPDRFGDVRCACTAEPITHPILFTYCTAYLTRRRQDRSVVTVRRLNGDRLR